MSPATAGIVIPVLSMLGAALVLVGSLPVAGIILDAREERPPLVATVLGHGIPTARVTRPAYCPSRRARRDHTGAHRWTGLAIGQRRPHELLTTHTVRSHAA